MNVRNAISGLIAVFLIGMMSGMAAFAQTEDEGFTLKKLQEIFPFHLPQRSSAASRDSGTVYGATFRVENMPCVAFADRSGNVPFIFIFPEKPKDRSSYWMDAARPQVAALRDALRTEFRTVRATSFSDKISGFAIVVGKGRDIKLSSVIGADLTKVLSYFIFKKDARFASYQDGEITLAVPAENATSKAYEIRIPLSKNYVHTLRYIPDRQSQSSDIIKDVKKRLLVSDLDSSYSPYLAVNGDVRKKTGADECLSVGSRHALVRVKKKYIVGEISLLPSYVKTVRSERPGKGYQFTYPDLDQTVDNVRELLKGADPDTTGQAIADGTGGTGGGDSGEAPSAGKDSPAFKTPEKALSDYIRYLESLSR